MNNIILNGVNSNTIPSLIIQELPPISKPLMRTQIEEIDGRDGDIVTKLGYSAYDKEISIGLRNSLNINDVIKFFDSEGQVIFSNEPDKYYRYQILDQIDFDRLLRYRTADVTFHVQPFKYSATEQDIDEYFAVSAPKTLPVTNSGNTTSKPHITITGNGTINLSLNGTQVFVIEMGNIGYISLDAETMEASQGGILRNRLVTGNYDNFVFQIGDNTLTWTGDVSEISVSNYSRWI
jgi:predicted phage tail component-like protein